MISYNEAIQQILATAIVKDTEEVDLPDAVNRVPSEHAYSDINLPPFNKSAMDGYVCRKNDITNELTIVETIPAGKQPTKSIGRNECAKIMTGAVIPDGGDLVFMQEDAEVLATNKVRCTNPNTRSNICYLGEDIKEGQQILSAGTLIRPRHLPILAGAGITKVKVHRQPNIALYATGTELVEPDRKPAPHQIRNTNAVQLHGQLASMDIKAWYGGILTDENEMIGEKIQQALNNNDLIIFTGGVSVGEYDLIPDLLEKAGFNIVIRKTAIQPGKPMIFAVRENTYCFGLSGNPVSSYIQFELYVKPFIYRIMGHDYKPRRYQMPLKGYISRKKTDRLLFKPARISENQIEPLEFHGSAHINSLAYADGLIEFPVGQATLNDGDLVTVRMIDS